MSNLKAELAKHRAGKKSDSAKTPSVSELLGASEVADVSAVVAKAKEQGRLLELGPECFVPDPSQPRKTFDEDRIAELRVSIENNGQLQPILVGKPMPDGKYPIIAGERRWRAISGSSVVGSVIAIVQGGDLSELSLLRMQIDENNQREQIPAIENAVAMKRIVDLCKAEGKDQAYAAKVLNVSAGQLSKQLALLSAAPVVQNLSLHGETQDVEVLYNLAKASETDPDTVKDLIENWRSGDLETNLRQASKAVKDAAADKAKKPSQKKPKVSGAKAKEPAKKKDSILRASDISLVEDEKGADYHLSVSVDGGSATFLIGVEVLEKLEKEIVKVGKK